MENHCVVVLVVASLLSPCWCQLEMGGLLDGMGGLALLSAGGGLGNNGPGSGGASNLGNTAANPSNRGGSVASGTGGSVIGGTSNMNPLEMGMMASLMDLEMGAGGMMGLSGLGMGTGLGTGMGTGLGTGMGAGMGAGMAGGIAGQIGPMIRMLTTMGGELGPMGIRTVVRSMVTPMIASQMVNSKMNEVVKVVVGPHARPSQEMMAYAMSEMKPPSSPKDLFAYMNLMLDIAKKQGIFMPDGTIQEPVMESVNGKGKKTGPTLEQVRNLIMKRSLMWFKSQGPPRPKKGRPPKSAGKAV